jgi:cell wall-associated NlpC family hydrolase
VLRQFIAAIIAFAAIVLSASAQSESSYHSPYKVEFTTPEPELIGDVLAGRRGATAELSSFAPKDWGSPEVRKRYGAWGPPLKQLPAPDGFDSKPAAWKRERLIAVGLRYVGLPYQHHHLPDWDPPADWPWLEVKHGQNSKGLDCSNFTTFVYDVALGMQPTSHVLHQSELKSAPGPGPGKTTPLTRVEIPARHEDLAKTFRTGDLLFIKNTKGEVSHVVFWVGAIGKTSDGTPLVLDSTGSGRKDANGVDIPDGVNLRPCTESSWYFRSASHVLRAIPDDRP